jgi:hypothetical protein
LYSKTNIQVSTDQRRPVGPTRRSSVPSRNTAQPTNFSHLLKASDVTIAKLQLRDEQNPDLQGRGFDSTEIIEVLRRTAECVSLDPRDRIYGILGMTTVNRRYASEQAKRFQQHQSPDPSYDLVVDYNKSASQVF